MITNEAAYGIPIHLFMKTVRSYQGIFRKHIIYVHSQSVRGELGLAGRTEGQSFEKKVHPFFSAIFSSKQDQKYHLI